MALIVHRKSYRGKGGLSLRFVARRGKGSRTLQWPGESLDSVANIKWMGLIPFSSLTGWNEVIRVGVQHRGWSFCRPPNAWQQCPGPLRISVPMCALSRNLTLNHNRRCQIGDVVLRAALTERHGKVRDSRSVSAGDTGQMNQHAGLQAEMTVKSPHAL